MEKKIKRIIVEIPYSEGFEFIADRMVQSAMSRFSIEVRRLIHRIRVKPIFEGKGKIISFHQERINMIEKTAYIVEKE
jgi:hypothetical protein